MSSAHCLRVSDILRMVENLRDHQAMVFPPWMRKLPRRGRPRTKVTYLVIAKLDSDSRSLCLQWTRQPSFPELG